MLHVKVYKEKILPPTLKPDSLYFIENGDIAEMYFTDKNGVAKFVGNSILINDIVSNYAFSGDKTYVHNQGIPSNTWIINHGLDKMPSVTVIDSAGSEIEGSVTHLNDNNLIINFNSSFSGKAILN